ncbi:MAG TPA: hypothetical protein VMA72_02085 [Streptosporangiaceae bacterium]|nr:hypothetical protein [Streptosporangiaceae bacterium]
MRDEVVRRPWVEKRRSIGAELLQEIAQLLALARVKEGTGHSVIVSRNVCNRSCLQALPLGLVDEIRVRVIPVLSGGGTPVFDTLDSAITFE